MSTRSTTHFVDGGEVPEAIIYRHSDGYPTGQGKDLLEFFEEVQRQTQDTRFSDPAYLAAKLVVWLAPKFARSYKFPRNGGPGKWVKNKPLDFLSVGVVMRDPGDIAYRYIVDCSDLSRGRPAVYVVEMDRPEKQLGEIEDVLKKEVA